jgi:hypothetical protein
VTNLFEHVSTDRRGWLLLAGSGAALAASLGLPGVAVGADTNFAGCDKPYDPYAQSASTLATCGVKTFPLKSKTLTSDRGTAYNYDVNGKAVSFKVPPPGFNPRTASADELALYGIPRRPSPLDPKATKWDAAVSKLSFVKPPPFLAAVPVKAQTQDENDQWSGYENLAGGEDLFYDSTGVWVEPTVQQPNTCPNNSAVFWVGIGGFYTSDLAQNGTALNTPGVAQHQAWKEILPEPIFPVPLFATGGQSFKAETRWLGPGIGPGEFQFNWWNQYTGQMLSMDSAAPVVDDHSSEFIAERPSVGGVPRSLTNFGQINWSSALSNGLAIQNFPWAADTMVNFANGNVLAHPTTIPPGNNGAFTDTWKNCS